MSLLLYKMNTKELECNKNCTPERNLYDAKCPVHGAKSMLRALKQTRGKRTSEGYKPESTEKVELRGD